jgi:glycosyltransferase involved in cell wall biosynthesis
LFEFIKIKNNDVYLKDLINKRNSINNINIIIPEKINIKIIYNQTRILLIPSICEETFCRVAYEGMINKIPIISTNNGNLKYLLEDYALFINELDIKKWVKTIQYLYNNRNLIINFHKRKKNILHLMILQIKY